MVSSGVMPEVRHDEEWARALIRKVSANRDESAFQALYLHYYDRLFRFIVQIGRRPEIAEDVLNETMWVVWERANSFDFTSKLSTWILSIAYRKTLKAGSKCSRTDEHASLDDVSDALPGAWDDAMLNVELDDWLRDALQALPVEQRAVLELTYYHELSYREVAEVLGCPENTVKTRMFHARKKLQSRWQTLEVRARDVISDGNYE